MGFINFVLIRFVSGFIRALKNLSTIIGAIVILKFLVEKKDIIFILVDKNYIISIIFFSIFFLGYILLVIDDRKKHLEDADKG